MTFVEGDVRTAALHAGTVFFLYVPFTGPALSEVMSRLREVACQHAIVVCALGVELAAEAPWLSRRPLDAFWLTVYDSVISGCAGACDPPRRAGARRGDGERRVRKIGDAVEPLKSEGTEVTRFGSRGR